MIEVGKKLQFDFIKQYIGQTISVLFEETDEYGTWGYSKEYIRALIEDNVIKGEIYDCIVTEIYQDYVKVSLYDDRRRKI